MFLLPFFIFHRRFVQLLFLFYLTPLVEKVTWINANLASLILSSFFCVENFTFNFLPSYRWTSFKVSLPLTLKLLSVKWSFICTLWTLNNEKSSLIIVFKCEILWENVEFLFTSMTLQVNSTCLNQWISPWNIKKINFLLYFYLFSSFISFKIIQKMMMTIIKHHFFLFFSFHFLINLYETWT
jgi:hypothetical protein